MHIVKLVNPAPHPQACALETNVTDLECETVVTWCRLLEQMDYAQTSLNRVEANLHGAIMFCPDNDVREELTWLKNYLARLA